MAFVIRRTLASGIDSSKRTWFRNSKAWANIVGKDFWNLTNIVLRVLTLGKSSKSNISSSSSWLIISSSTMSCEAGGGWQNWWWQSWCWQSWCWWGQRNIPKWGIIVLIPFRYIVCSNQIIKFMKNWYFNNTCGNWHLHYLFGNIFVVFIEMGVENFYNLSCWNLINNIHMTTRTTSGWLFRWQTF